MKQTTDNDPIAKEGFILIAIPLLLSALFAFWHWAAAIPFWALTLFTVYFFRNPKRTPPVADNAVASPADGTVIGIGTGTERYFSGRACQKITIFMSPFNVHVNRAPVTGIVSNTHYQKGKFLAAFSELASLENEQSALEIVTPRNQRIVFVQIAGWLARRIVTYAQKSDLLQKGQIFGLIRFGSRMDIYLPPEAKIQVQMKQKVYAGKTQIAEW